MFHSVFFETLTFNRVKLLETFYPDFFLFRIIRYYLLVSAVLAAEKLFSLFFLDVLKWKAVELFCTVKK